jgi:uncharacterized spore protein YtfJ
MNEQDQSFYAMSLQNVTQVHDLIGRLFRVAEPGAVYGEPIVSGERTIVVTSELSMAIGAGVGFGHSVEPESTASNSAGAGANGGTSASTPEHKDETGGGGGGGGYSFGRPVAAVIIEPAGVRVEPIVDPTKLGIAFFTTLGAMFFAWTSLRRTTNQLAIKQLSADKRTVSKLERAAMNEARRQAKRAAKLAGREAKQATRAAKRAAKEVAKDVAKEAAKRAPKLLAKDAA